MDKAYDDAYPVFTILYITRRRRIFFFLSLTRKEVSDDNEYHIAGIRQDLSLTFG